MCTSLPFSAFGVQQKPYTSKPDGTDGNQNCPLNFPVFKCVNKHVLYKFSRGEKIVNDFFIGLIFVFEVRGGGELFLKLQQEHEFLNMWCQT